MNSLPDDIRDIVFKYYYQIEHSLKFKNCLEEIENIDYCIEDSEIFNMSFRDCDVVYIYDKFFRTLEVQTEEIDVLEDSEIEDY